MQVQLLFIAVAIMLYTKNLSFLLTKQEQVSLEVLKVLAQLSGYMVTLKAFTQILEQKNKLKAFTQIKAIVKPLIETNRKFSDNIQLNTKYNLLTLTMVLTFFKKHYHHA